MEHKILDKGFVRLVDFMGGDMAVVQAARVSFGQETKGEIADRKLINYLMKHGHETPFEMSVFKFHVKAPIFVARQWFRHRIGSYNEISHRYVEVEDEFYIPEQLRTPDTKNRQNSLEGGFSELETDLLRSLIAVSYADSYQCYRTLLEHGIAREQARMVLPVATYTQFYVTYNSRSLMNFIRLRTGNGAQWEIAQYAKALEEIFAAKMPWSCQAFLAKSGNLTTPIV